MLKLIRFSHLACCRGALERDGYRYREAEDAHYPLSRERQSTDLVPLLCYYPPATLCPHSSCTYSFACFTSYIVFYAFFTVIHSTVSRERTTYAACYSTQRVEEGRLTRLSRRAGRRDPMYYNYQHDSSTNTERSVSSAALLRPTACLARSPSCCLRVLEGRRKMW
jgi:hypothetical protein